MLAGTPLSGVLAVATSLAASLNTVSTRSPPSAADTLHARSLQLISSVVSRLVVLPRRLRLGVTVRSRILRRIRGWILRSLLISWRRRWSVVCCRG